MFVFSLVLITGSFRRMVRRSVAAPGPTRTLAYAEDVRKTKRPESGVPAGLPTASSFCAPRGTDLSRESEKGVLAAVTLKRAMFSEAHPRRKRMRLRAILGMVGSHPHRCCKPAKTYWSIVFASGKAALCAPNAPRSIYAYVRCASNVPRTSTPVVFLRGMNPNNSAY